MQFEAPPNRTDFPQVANEKIFSRPWLNWFQSISTFFNTPVTVTGSRASGAALDDLLTQLASKGIIMDNTTP